MRGDLRLPVPCIDACSRVEFDEPSRLPRDRRDGYGLDTGLGGLTELERLLSR